MVRSYPQGEGSSLPWRTARLTSSRGRISSASAIAALHVLECAPHVRSEFVSLRGVMVPRGRVGEKHPAGGQPSRGTETVHWVPVTELGMALTELPARERRWRDVGYKRRRRKGVGRLFLPVESISAPPDGGKSRQIHLSTCMELK